MSVAAPKDFNPEEAENLEDVRLAHLSLRDNCDTKLRPANPG
jgi:hypothetical protein